VTGNADLQLSAYESAGFRTVLRKPFKPKHLLEVIRTVTAGRQPVAAYPPSEFEIGEDQMYDLSDLRQILSNDPEAISGILTSLSSSSTINLKALDAAIGEMDSKTIGELVHKMAPMFRQIHAGKIIKYLAAVGNKDSDQVEKRQHFDRLSSEINALFEGLRDQSII
jgi:hypothetical protein